MDRRVEGPLRRKGLFGRHVSRNSMTEAVAGFGGTGPHSDRRGDLVFHHRLELRSELRPVDMTMGRHRMLRSGLQHLHLPARDRQRAVRLTWEISAVENLSRHV